MTFVRIESGYFVAGVVLDEDHVAERAAPIVNYMRNWHIDKILRYTNKKNWKVEIYE